MPLSIYCSCCITNEISEFILNSSWLIALKCSHYFHFVLHWSLNLALGLWYPLLSSSVSWMSWSYDAEDSRFKLVCAHVITYSNSSISLYHQLYLTWYYENQNKARKKTNPRSSLSSYEEKSSLCWKPVICDKTANYLTQFSLMPDK